VAGVGEDNDREGAQSGDCAGPADDADGCSVWLEGVAGAEMVDDEDDEVAN